MTINRRVLLVDFYNLFIRCFNVVPITNENGDHFGGTFGFLRGLKSAIDLFTPTDVIIVSDGPNAALRRKMSNKDYKANRSKEWKRGVVKAFDFLNEREQSDSFNYQVKRIHDYLSVLPVRSIGVPYVEADDIIAEICNTTDYDCIIYSTDADYKQLVSDRVVCYNPMAKQLTSVSTFREKFGFIPENFIHYKTIIGDKSDGLDGVKGIGPKTFLKLFPEAKEEIFESTDDLIKRSLYIVASKGKGFSSAIKAKHQLLIDNEDVIRENWKLMQLKDADISLQTKDLVRELLQRPPHKFNRTKLRLMFLEDKLQAQVKSFDGWSMTFSRLMTKG